MIGMQPLPAIFALLTGVAGWYYLFYSKAAQRLEGIEEQRLNQKRVRLRRTGGVMMLLLAVLFFAGFNTVRVEDAPAAFVAIWLGVMVLLGAIAVLALMDLRLTHQIRLRSAGA